MRLSPTIHVFLGVPLTGRAIRCNAHLPYGTARAFPLLSLTQEGLGFGEDLFITSKVKKQDLSFSRK
jgi:hypothetical protein